MMIDNFEFMYNSKLPVILFFFLNVISGAYSQERTYHSKKISPGLVTIDGQFNEAAWDSVAWQGHFIQREPYDSASPSQQTEFKILYDDNNLYVAIKAFDTEPEKIEKRLTRRDQLEGDLVAIGLDSYADKLTAFAFVVSAAGVKSDQLISNENSEDLSWDPVWYVKTAIINDGWNAEMRIPFTQLRFAQKEEHIWGLQVVRWLFRKEEFSAWQHVPRESSRWVSLWGELQGINGIKPKKEVEMIPYVMGKTERFEKEEGNPFATGKHHGYSLGVDGKVAVTNDMTLNFTLNPDFGQVEADPSEVNLTAFETFFPEKRPFFIEGNNIYNYSLTEGGGDLSSDNLFYSRRIGRSPHYTYDPAENEYMDYPEFTRIMGAFKLSGKTRNGLSVGVLESITQETKASVDLEGEKRKILVEPMTNYFNTRIQKDFDKGNTIFGGMVTATNRKIYDTELDSLHHAAYTGGLDFTHFWKDKTYFIWVNTVFSHIRGNCKSILKLQESPRRYYQRPDADHLQIDSSAKLLTGNGGTIEAGKTGNGHWKYVGWITWRTPGLELNDMGYLRQGDIIQQVAWAGYNIWEPFSVFRSFNLNFNQWSGWDFSGTRIYLGGNINGHAQFKNYWSVGCGINRAAGNLNRSELRGGPAIRFPGDWNTWLSINSDNRKKLVISASIFDNWGDLDHSQMLEASVGLTYRPLDILSLTLEPGYSNRRRNLQYVETRSLNNENRYLIATLNSETFSTNLRIDFSITPDLTVQFWGQPFLFAGNYSSFKRITNPVADNYNDRFHIFSESEILYRADADSYDFDEDSDGNWDYSIENPNFNFFEFRSNLVVRWEYIPGSTLYLVWSQGRSDSNELGIFDFDKNFNDLWTVVAHNVFLIKASFRISM
ncbi:MAG: carbohydrate binding family 9 domain-containing protein [Bacteroidetes bacterium]|nr:carbohydrate binding family 9 domain-containing protein [Bacteroidota bacterium]